MAQIDKPNLHFNTKLHSGTNSTTTITGVGFQPDWTWWKSRNNAVNHAMYDAVRGGSKLLRPNQANAEENNAAVSAFTSDGVTLTGGDSFTNASGYTYVSWNWKANGAGSSNTGGSITSTVSANATSGVSIIKYTGTGSAATVGHGLSAIPKMIIIKGLTNTSAENWRVFHHKTSAQRLIWNDADAAGNSTDFGANGSGGTITQNINYFNIGTDARVNGSGAEYIAYCFTDKKGFSKFGSYNGNGSSDGPFIYTGFKPAFVMVKRTNAGGFNWYINDNKRKTFNTNSTSLFTNTNSAETSDGMYLDMLSNGFKIRETGNAVNNSSGSHVYMAFAQNPIVGSNNIPATAE
jgi:hypothetical protein